MTLPERPSRLIPMNTAIRPTKEEGYRFLRVGEVIQEGDGFWDAFQLTWVEVRATVGLDVDDASKGHYRRPKL